MDTIETRCPHCHARFRLTPGQFGTFVRCGRCRQTFTPSVVASPPTEPPEFAPAEPPSPTPQPRPTAARVVARPVQATPASGRAQERRVRPARADRPRRKSDGGNLGLILALLGGLAVLALAAVAGIGYLVLSSREPDIAAAPTPVPSPTPMAEPAAPARPANRAGPPTRADKDNPIADTPLTKPIREATVGLWSPTRTGLGSGVVAGPPGHVVTTARAIKSTPGGFGSPDVKVMIASGREERIVPARVVRVSTTADLALIQVDDPNLPRPIPFGQTDQLQVGQEVRAFGLHHRNPRDAGASVARLRITRIRPAGPLGPTVEVSQDPLDRGFNGGPVASDDGTLVGLCSLEPGLDRPRLIPAEQVDLFLTGRRPPNRQPPSGTPPSSPGSGGPVAGQPPQPPVRPMPSPPSAPAPTPSAPTPPVAQGPATPKLPPDPTPDVDPSKGTPAQLAAGAKHVLATYCYRCHGKDGADEGGFGSVLDRRRLVGTKQVVPGEAARSRLLRRVAKGEMPPPDEKVTVPAADLDTLTRWVAAGAPDWGPATARRFITLEDEVRLVAADLAKQNTPRGTQPTVLYFTLTPLYNAGVPDEELEVYRVGFAKLLNSLSWKPEVVLPEPINPERTVYRVDVRATGFNKLGLTGHPYSLSLRLPDDPNPFRPPTVRMDWFLAAASRPPVYHDMAAIPWTVAELEKRLKVAAGDNIKARKVIRAGFNGSGVSRHNRLIERHTGEQGYYWKSYDFAGSKGRQNLFAFPLGPGPSADQSTFRHDGGEVIFRLPNGLHGYMLTDGRGNRLDRGPTDIVSDPRHPDRVVENGVSCMSCHAGGLIDKADQVRPLAEGGWRPAPGGGPDRGPCPVPASRGVRGGGQGRHRRLPGGPGQGRGPARRPGPGVGRVPAVRGRDRPPPGRRRAVADPRAVPGEGQGPAGVRPDPRRGDAAPGPGRDGQAGRVRGGLPDARLPHPAGAHVRPAERPPPREADPDRPGRAGRPVPGRPPDDHPAQVRPGHRPDVPARRGEVRGRRAGPAVRPEGRGAQAHPARPGGGVRGRVLPGRGHPGGGRPGRRDPAHGHRDRAGTRPDDRAEAGAGLHLHVLGAGVLAGREGPGRGRARRAGGLRFYDPFTGRSRRFVAGQFNNGRLALAYTPDGRHLLNGKPWSAVAVDPKTGRQRRLSQDGDRALTALTFSPDGKSACLTYSMNVIRLIDVATLDAVVEERVMFAGGPTDPALCAPVAAAFSPDGGHLAVAHKGGYLTVWTSPALRLVRTVRCEPDAPHSLQSAPDGKRLAAWGSDGVIQYWDWPALARAGD